MGGKNVKTCLQLIKDYTADMTPEWAEEITSVPADTIRRIANELVDHALIGSTIELDGETFPFRPAGVLAPGRGSNSNPLNVELFKAIEVVNELLGCIDVPGGILGLEHGDLHVMDTDDDGMLLPPASDNFRNQAVGQEKLSFPPKSYKLECFYPHELHVMQLVWRAALDPESYYLDYKPEVYMVLGGGNPLRSNSNPEAVVEVLKQIPFTFTISLWMDEMTQFADVVLPEHHALERYALWNASWISNKSASDYVKSLRVLEARKPVVEPVFDTRQQEDLLIEWASRLGILPKMTGIANKGFQGKFLPGKPGGIADEMCIRDSATWCRTTRRSPTRAIFATAATTCTTSWATSPPSTASTSRRCRTCCSWASCPRASSSTASSRSSTASASCPTGSPRL